MSHQPFFGAGVARMARPVRMAGIGLAALLLAACGSSPKSAPEPLPPACPTALILEGAQRTSAYRPGSERSPDALRYLAEIRNLASGCRFGDQGVDVDVAFDLIADRGPAADASSVQLTYFVATIGPDRQILAKQLLDSEIVFAAGEEFAGVAEQLTLRLPSVTPEQAAAYGLYLGFQLDDAQLEERLQPLLR